jgi:hypothetical protein
LIERSKERQATEVVMVGMGEEERERWLLAAGRRVSQLAGKFVSQRYYARTSVHDEEVIAVPYLQAGGIAAEARARDQSRRVSTTYAPEAHAKATTIGCSESASNVGKCFSGGALRRLGLAVK